MTAREKRTYIAISNEFTRTTAADRTRRVARGPEKPPFYDPELLYVECQVCGKPVLWEKGRTTELLLTAGVDVSNLDERCLIVSEGCPSCSPFEKEGYTLAVVRIAGLTPEEAAHMSSPGGSA